MINLMYIVLTAMLALNVSSDVLDGFTQVDDGLKRTNDNVGRRNDVMFALMEEQYRLNPVKTARWYEAALAVREESEVMYRMIDSLKHAIVRQADGKDYDMEAISDRENLEAASAVMLNPVTRRGESLHKAVDRYREMLLPNITDSVKRHGIADALSTADVSVKGLGVDKKWEEAKFENQPVVAAVTLLTKLENDVRYAEGEALASLTANIDAGDVRVNELNAFVIPRSQYVMRGSRYVADIVLAAIDTTARPQIFVNGKQLEGTDGRYELLTSSTGTFDYSGYLSVTHGDGSVTRHPFSSQYTVMEPTATVSATMMNVLYGGIDNPLSISVPGVPQSAVSATMTNGTLTRTANGWTARPQTVDQEAVVTVSADIDGTRRVVGSTAFKVRSLPDPTAYIALQGADGRSERYRGGRPVAKSLLLASKGLGAAIDDGILDIEFTVTGFETIFFDSMGNAMPEVSDGSKFSRRQLDSFKRMQRGKRFFISRIKAVGPDGTTRTLSPIEVTVN